MNCCSCGGFAYQVGGELVCAPFATQRKVQLPEESITVEQAVNAYTSGSAYARFSEDRLGTLEAGKEADLTVLSQDIFSVAPQELAKTHVVMTMVGGNVVFTEKP